MRKYWHREASPESAAMLAETARRTLDGRCGVLEKTNPVF
jgi:hypothetical protein